MQIIELHVFITNWQFRHFKNSKLMHRIFVPQLKRLSEWKDDSSYLRCSDVLVYSFDILTIQRIEDSVERFYRNCRLLVFSSYYYMKRKYLFEKKLKYLSNVEFNTWEISIKLFNINMILLNVLNTLEVTKSTIPNQYAVFRYWVIDLY